MLMACELELVVFVVDRSAPSEVVVGACVTCATDVLVVPELPAPVAAEVAVEAEVAAEAATEVDVVAAAAAATEVSDEVAAATLELAAAVVVGNNEGEAAGVEGSAEAGDCEEVVSSGLGQRVEMLAELMVASSDVESVVVVVAGSELSGSVESDVLLCCGLESSEVL